MLKSYGWVVVVVVVVVAHVILVSAQGPNPSFSFFGGLLFDLGACWTRTWTRAWQFVFFDWFSGKVRNFLELKNMYPWSGLGGSDVDGSDYPSPGWSHNSWSSHQQPMDPSQQHQHSSIFSSFRSSTNATFRLFVCKSVSPNFLRSLNLHLSGSDIAASLSQLSLSVPQVYYVEQTEPKSNSLDNWEDEYL